MACQLVILSACQERAVLEKMLDQAKTSGALKTAQDIKEVSLSDNDLEDDVNDVF